MRPRNVSREHEAKEHEATDNEIGTIIKAMYPCSFKNTLNILNTRVQEQRQRPAEDYRLAYWDDFVRVRKDVTAVSRNTPLPIIVAKIAKAEQLRDKLGFDVSAILASLQVVMLDKKCKLQEKLRDLENAAPTWLRNG